MIRAAARPPAPPAEVVRFAERFASSLADASFARLVLTQPRAGAAGATGVRARRIALHGAPFVQFMLRHPTRDEVRNLPEAEAVDAVVSWLVGTFDHGHLQTSSHDIQIALTKKGAWQLRSGRLPQAQAAMAVDGAHNRERRHPLSLQAPFLTALGVTDAQQRLVPAMARKWRQIVKFVEVLDHAINASPVHAAKSLRVLDFGAGRGYLTFATHHHLLARGIAARVTGVELRAELTEAGNGIARGLDLQGLDFVAGDIHGHPPEPVDLMIALHACDIATDVAMHRGALCGASIIVCAPCCHKEVRPQLQVPPVLEPLLRHGIHRSECAEMLTDGLRALLLRLHGYDTQVFEFVSPEHTGKNKIVLAVRRAQPLPASAQARLRQQLNDLKAFFGLRTQYLETLFAADQATSASTTGAAGAGQAGTDRARIASTSP